MATVGEVLTVRCRTKQRIVKLQDHRSDVSLPSVELKVMSLSILKR